MDLCPPMSIYIYKCILWRIINWTEPIKMQQYQFGNRSKRIIFLIHNQINALPTKPSSSTSKLIFMFLWPQLYFMLHSWYCWFKCCEFKIFLLNVFKGSMLPISTKVNPNTTEKCMQWQKLKVYYVNLAIVWIYYSLICRSHCFIQ